MPGVMAWVPEGFHFATPAWFALLPVVWWLAWRVRTTVRRQASTPLLIHPDAAGFGPMARGRSKTRRWWLVALGGSLLIVALARPQSLGPWIKPPPRGRQLVLLVDASQSMSISDFHYHGHRVQRIDVLKGVVTRFIEARRADRFALITFASRAATLVPMTSDRRLVKAMLQRLQVGVIGDDTAIGDALVLALKQIHAHGGPRPALILLSDGDNTAGQVRPRDAVAIARQLGVVVYTVAIGGETSSASATKAPHNAAAPIGLREIARRTRGRYYRGGSPEALRSILRDIDRLERTGRPAPTRHRLIEWYLWPLGGGALLFVLAGLSAAGLFPARRRAAANSTRVAA